MLSVSFIFFDPLPALRLQFLTLPHSGKGFFEFDPEFVQQAFPRLECALSREVVEAFRELLHIPSEIHKGLSVDYRPEHKQLLRLQVEYIEQEPAETVFGLRIEIRDALVAVVRRRRFYGVVSSVEYVFAELKSLFALLALQALFRTLSVEQAFMAIELYHKTSLKA